MVSLKKENSLLELNELNQFSVMSSRMSWKK